MCDLTMSQTSPLGVCTWRNVAFIRAVTSPGVIVPNGRAERFRTHETKPSLILGLQTQCQRAAALFMPPTTKPKSTPKNLCRVIPSLTLVFLRKCISAALARVAEAAVRDIGPGLTCSAEELDTAKLCNPVYDCKKTPTTQNRTHLEKDRYRYRHGCKLSLTTSCVSLLYTSYLGFTLCCRILGQNVHSFKDSPLFEEKKVKWKAQWNYCQGLERQIWCIFAVFPFFFFF